MRAVEVGQLTRMLIYDADAFQTREASVGEPEFASIFYCTGKLAGGEVAPLILMTTGWTPEGTPAGTSTFT